MSLTTKPRQPNDKNSNSTVHCWYGRFGNHLIRNICASIIAKKHGLKFRYSFNNDIVELMGIPLFNEGQNFYDSTVECVDADIDLLLGELDDAMLRNREAVETTLDTPFSETAEPRSGGDNIQLNTNIDVNKLFAQTPITARVIRNHITENKPNIISKNKFKERYGTNEDIFVHIRLGDLLTMDHTKGAIPPFEYYLKTIVTVVNEKMENQIFPSQYKIYITSDSIGHISCQRLIRHFNMVVFADSEINTIMFGSTCSSLILSNGTFSWWLGVLGFNSTVYFPETKNTWHGDIFVFDDWHKMHFTLTV
jgi:hypothetical protein